MPTPEFARDLVLEAEEWVEEGLLTREQALRLRERYRDLLSAPSSAQARSAGGGGVASAVLYATAGVLLGAAAIVVVAVGLEATQDAFLFVVAGTVLLVAGIALDLAGRRGNLADAVLVGALVPMAVAPFTDGLEGLALVGVAGASLGLLYWRRDSLFVPPLAAVAFTVGVGAAFVGFFEASEGAPWLGAQLVLLAAVLAIDRLVEARDRMVPAAVAAAAVALPLMPLASETLRLTSEAAEIVIGVVMLAVLGLGVGMRHKGVAIGAAAAVCVDAVVFSFDVGGALTGTLTLLGLAAVLVWQAEMLKGWLAEA